MADLTTVIELVGVDAGASRAAREVSSALDGLTASGERSNIVMAAGAVAFGALAVAAGTLVGAVAYLGIAFDSMKEQALIAFGVLMGSADKAKQHLADLIQFAAVTPFEVSQLTAASQKLQAFGFDAQAVIPMLRTIGDAASAGIVPMNEAMGRITYAFGQVLAAGHLTMQEVRQLSEVGINAVESISKGLGQSMADTRKDIEAAAIDSGTALHFIMLGMEEKFAGLSDKMSHSLVGLLSNLHDYASSLSGTVMLPVFERLKSGIEGIVGAMGSDQFKASAAKMAQVLDAIMIVGGQVVGVLKGPVGQAFSEVGAIANDVVSGKMSEATTKLESLMGRWAKTLGGWVTEGWNLIKKGIDALSSALGTWVNEQGEVLKKKFTDVWIPAFMLWLTEPETGAADRFKKELGLALDKLAVWAGEEDGGVAAMKKIGAVLMDALSKAMSVGAGGKPPLGGLGIVTPTNALVDLAQTQPGGKSGAEMMENWPQTPPTAPNTSLGGVDLSANRGAIDSSSRSAFFRSAFPYAQAIQDETGIPYDVILGMMASESNFGATATGPHASNALFGIKGFNPTTGASVMAGTHEDDAAGNSTNIVDRFRAYDSPGGSVADFVELLRTQRGGNGPGGLRYSAALEQGAAGNGLGFLTALTQAGYATNPTYPAFISDIAGQARTATAGMRNFSVTGGGIVQPPTEPPPPPPPPEPAAAAPSIADRIVSGVTNFFAKLRGPSAGSDLPSPQANDTTGSDSQTPAVVPGLTGARFLSAFHAANLSGGMSDEINKMMKATEDAIRSGSDENVALMGKFGAELIVKIADTAPPEQGAIWINELMDAIETAADEKTPEAIQHVRDLAESINFNLPLAKLGDEMATHINVATQNAFEQITKAQDTFQTAADTAVQNMVEGRAARDNRRTFTDNQKESLDRLTDEIKLSTTLYDRQEAQKTLARNQERAADDLKRSRDAADHETALSRIKQLADARKAAAASLSGVEQMTTRDINGVATGIINRGSSSPIDDQLKKFADEDKDLIRRRGLEDAEKKRKDRQASVDLADDNKRQDDRANYILGLELGLRGFREQQARDLEHYDEIQQDTALGHQIENLQKARDAAIIEANTRLDTIEAAEIIKWQNAMARQRLLNGEIAKGSSATADDYQAPNGTFTPIPTPSAAPPAGKTPSGQGQLGGHDGIDSSSGQHTGIGGGAKANSVNVQMNNTVIVGPGGADQVGEIVAASLSGKAKIAGLVGV